MPLQLQQPGPSLSQQEQRSYSRQRKQQMGHPNSDTRVHIYDMRSILSISHSMSGQLHVTGTVADVCEHNRQICLNEGKRDLSHIWQLVSHITNPSVCTTPISHIPWSLHPFARRTIRSM